MPRQFSAAENLDLSEAELAEAMDVATDINTKFLNPDYVLEVAELCHRVQTKMPDGPVKTKIKTSVEFGPAKFSKFVTIGSQSRLRDDEVKRQLPPHFTILYLIARLEPEALEWALTEDIITPRCKASDIEPLIPDFKPKPKREPADIEIHIANQEDATLLPLIEAIRSARDSGLIKLKLRSDCWNKILSVAHTDDAPSITIPHENFPESQVDSRGDHVETTSKDDMIVDREPALVPEANGIDPNA